MPRFQDRAMVKAYVERADLERLAARAAGVRQSVSEYVAGLILEDLDAGGDPENLRRTDPDVVGRRGTTAPERIAERRTEPPRDKGAVVTGGASAPYDPSAHSKPKSFSKTVAPPAGKKSKNWCSHGIMKGGRCMKCPGGIAR